MTNKSILLNVQENETIEDITKRYKQLLKIHHPDQGGSDSDFIALQNEYKSFLENYKYKSTKYEEDNSTTETLNSLTDSMRKKVIEFLNQVYNYNITIELMGEWVWITGDTKSAKDILKNLGFKFSRKKTAWYYHEMENYKRYGKKPLSINDIRSRYGSSSLSKKEKEKRLCPR